MIPSGAIAQINVAISARCSSVSMPAKLINARGNKHIKVK